MPFDGSLLDQILGHPEMAGFVNGGQVDPNAQATEDAAYGAAGAQPYVPPSQAAPVSTPSDALPGTQPVNQSAAVSRSGYSEGVHQQLEKKMPAEARAEADAAAKARVGESADRAQVLEYGNQGADALRRKATAEAGQAAATAQGDLAMARLHQHFSITESMAAAHAAAMTAQYRAGLESDLAKVRALRVNSGQLMKDMTGTERLGSAAALFAQGFLGTRGIQTGSREALQYWIERSVSDQEAAVRNGQAMVESDKMLWDMARAQSHDDQEARDRVAAYLTAQAQAEIKAQVDSYGSALATANGDAAVAALGMDLNAKLAQITDRYDQKAQAAAAFVWNKYKFNVQMSMESRRISAMENKGKGTGGIPLAITHGVRTVDPKTGRAVVTNIIDPSYKPNQVEGIRNKIAAVSATNESLRKLSDHIAEIGRVYGGVGHATFQSTEKEMLIGERDRLAQDIAYAKWGARSGSKYDQEVERQIVRIDTMTQRADAQRILADYVTEQISGAQQDLAQHTVTVDKARELGWDVGDLEGAPVDQPGSWSQNEKIDQSNKAWPTPAATSFSQYLVGNMMVPGAQDANPDQHAYDAARDLETIAEGGKPTHSLEFNTSGALRPKPLDELKGKPTPDQQRDAYFALAAYASGQIKGGTNNYMRGFAESKLDAIDRERRAKGLPAFERPTVQDLAGFEPADVGSSADDESEESNEPAWASHNDDGSEGPGF